jgi:hypothetical protein
MVLLTQLQRLLVPIRLRVMHLSWKGRLRLALQEELVADPCS